MALSEERKIFFMSELASYDARVRDIQAYNQPILVGFRTWLEQSGLGEKEEVSLWKRT